MKFLLSLGALLALSQVALAGRYNLTCFYNNYSSNRGGFANLTETDLRASFEYCTHIVYGYVGLKPNNYELIPLLARQMTLFKQVRKLKNQYRHVKFLLSLGGGKDTQSPEKYLKLLEASAKKQEHFIQSVKQTLDHYHFDGLDLAYQFPRNKITKHSKVKKMAKNILSKVPMAKKLTGVSKHAKELTRAEAKYKQQFTALVNKLHHALSRDRLMLTLTMLPNVNTSAYINIPAIMNDLDFVNLGTFDYSTPYRTPHEADYLAPLKAPPHHGKHLPQANIEAEVRHWLSQHIQPRKLNLGIPAFARSWKMTKALASTNMPVHSSLDGPAPGGELLRMPGIFSMPEVCFKLAKMSKSRDKTLGNYAYRSAAVKGQDGMFITYEDRDSITAKVEYLERQNLGGVAVFDITLDDFRGKCKEGKFPILKAIKDNLH